jgi:GntR family transcriptional regulator/MocR family aminotransferase
MHIQEKPFSSFHLIAFFNEPKTIEEEAEIILKLKTIDVTVLSLGKCYVGPPEKTGLIFGYSSVRLNIIKQTIHKISQIIP